MFRPLTDLRGPILAGLLALTTACSAAPAATSPAAPTPTASSVSTTAAATASASAPVTATPTTAPATTPTDAATVPPTSEPTVTPEPTAIAKPAWERVADQQPFSGSLMRAVTVGPNLFVAVGRTWDPDEGPSGLAWTSTDGRTWVRAADALGEGDPTGVIWDGVRYTAFGGGGGVVPPAVWISPDGQSWQRAPEFTDNEVIVMHVASLDGSLFAIGGIFGGDCGDCEGPPTDTFRTWTSTDGLSWQPVNAEIPPPEMTQLGGLTAANGVLLAWGAVWDDDQNLAVVLRSSDGQTWEQTSIGEVGDGVTDIVGADGTFVAVGHGPYCCEAGGSSPIKAWTSADGLAWQDATFEPDAGIDALEHIVHYGGQYVSLGSSGSVTISWLSVDGTVWTESESVPDTEADEDPCTGGPCPNTTLHDLAAGTQGLVAVGVKRILDEDTGRLLRWDSVVWIAPSGGQ